LLIAGLQSAVLVVFHELFPVRMEKGAHLDVSVVCLVTALASIFAPPSISSSVIFSGLHGNPSNVCGLSSLIHGYGLSAGAFSG
jgi:hypothetical protein